MSMLIQPFCFLQRLNCPELLRMLICYDYLEEATAICIEYIDATMGVGYEHFDIKVTDLNYITLSHLKFLFRICFLWNVFIVPVYFDQPSGPNMASLQRNRTTSRRFKGPQAARKIQRGDFFLLSSEIFENDDDDKLLQTRVLLLWGQHNRVNHVGWHGHQMLFISSIWLGQWPPNNHGLQGRSIRPGKTLISNEKIPYLRKICCFDRMWHIPKQTTLRKMATWMSVVEVLLRCRLA